LPSGTVSAAGFTPLDTGRIGEQVAASRYADRGAAHPRDGDTRPEPGKAGAYSWLKAPRYSGEAHEVGPLARLSVAAAAGEEPVRQILGRVLAEAKLDAGALDSAIGRHAARAAESVLLAERMETWLDRLRVGEPSVAAYAAAAAGRGEGLTEAPRGALGHWVEIREHRIARYQCVVPSTWNFSPRGDKGDPGPVEAALVGLTVSPAHRGLEVARVVRSFDPCIACAVH
ncbi:MAG: nickel-dependent hydrogenase large subunit, partial [Proteobacteria bacterium]|nr:nickel-dependent hydrogenase large subunit [Pseudomonadota bacterium]